MIISNSKIESFPSIRDSDKIGLTYKQEDSIENYKNLVQLGKGAHGTVFKAIHVQSEKIVVIKQIEKKNFGKNLSKINQEIKLLSKLKHPFIISMLSSFDSENAVNIVMEYAENGDMHSYLKKMKSNGRKLVEDQIRKFAFQIFSGLHFIHSNNIIHRDIKTLNLFLDKNNDIKIGDFGISKLVSSNLFDINNPATRIGTPLYISPELIQNKAYDYKIDIWAAGCVIYHMAYFETPFKSENLISLGYKIVHSNPKIGSGYSKELENLIKICLNKSPSLRPTAETAIKLCQNLVFEKNTFAEEMASVSFKVQEKKIPKSLSILKELQKQNKENNLKKIGLRSNLENKEIFKDKIECFNSELKKNCFEEPLVSTNVMKSHAKLENCGTCLKELSFENENQIVCEDKERIIIEKKCKNQNSNKNEACKLNLIQKQFLNEVNDIKEIDRDNLTKRIEVEKESFLQKEPSSKKEILRIKTRPLSAKVSELMLRIHKNENYKQSKMKRVDQLSLPTSLNIINKIEESNTKLIIRSSKFVVQSQSLQENFQYLNPSFELVNEIASLKNKKIDENLNRKEISSFYFDDPYQKGNTVKETKQFERPKTALFPYFSQPNNATSLSRYNLLRPFSAINKLYN